MKVQYYVAASLDGFIADENHSLDWLFQIEEPGEDGYSDFISGVGALAMGSTTYEWILKHHVLADPDEPKPWPYEQPAWVFTTRSLEPPPGADVSFVKGDVREAFGEISRAADGRNIWIVGGGGVAAQFHEAGLLDEIILTLVPVILARGVPLLTERIASPPLRVLGLREHGNGLTEMRLEVVRKEESYAMAGSSSSTNG